MRNGTLPVVATSILMAVQFCCNCNCFLKTLLRVSMSYLATAVWTKTVKDLAAPSVPLFVMATVNCVFFRILFHISELELHEAKDTVLVCQPTVMELFITSNIACL